MRHLFALLAVLALLISPMSIAAAQVECAKAGPEAMAGMDAPAVKSMDAAKASHDCCDEKQKPPHHGKACAQVCWAMCATMSALPTSQIQLQPVEPMRLTAALSQPLRAHAPPRAERPPKLLA